MHIGRTEKKNLKINQISSKIPCVYIGMGLVALKKSFSSILVCNLASEDSQILFIGQNIFVFKEPFVGTLNLCLETPDTCKRLEIDLILLGWENVQKLF